MVEAVIDKAATNATKDELLAELTCYGMDARRLEFLRWLVDSGRDPEWDLTLVPARPDCASRRAA